MRDELQITSIFVHRSILQAQLRMMVKSAANWLKLATNCDYAIGYYDGYLDAIDQMAVGVELEVETPKRLLMIEAKKVV